MKRLIFLIISVFIISTSIGQDFKATTEKIDTDKKIEVRIGTSISFSTISTVSFSQDSTGVPVSFTDDNGFHQSGTIYFQNSDLYYSDLIYNTILSINVDVHIETKYGFNVFVKGVYVLPLSNSIEVGTPIYYYFSHTQFGGGSFYAGISKRVGSKVFGLYGETGLGFSSASKFQEINIFYEKGAGYSKEPDQVVSYNSNFTGISGILSAGVYINLGGFSMIPTYSATFVSRKDVGTAYLSGVNLSFGFKF
jgi:hypothetical protein